MFWRLWLTCLCLLDYLPSQILRLFSFGECGYPVYAFWIICPHRFLDYLALAIVVNLFMSFGLFALTDSWII